MSRQISEQNKHNEATRKTRNARSARRGPNARRPSPTNNTYPSKNFQAAQNEQRTNEPNPSRLPTNEPTQRETTEKDHKPIPARAKPTRGTVAAPKIPTAPPGRGAAQRPSPGESESGGPPKRHGHNERPTRRSPAETLSTEAGNQQRRAKITLGRSPTPNGGDECSFFFFFLPFVASSLRTNRHSEKKAPKRVATEGVKGKFFLPQSCTYE